MKTLNELITEYKNRPKNGLIVSLRYNKTASQELIDKTAFLNDYSDVNTSERLYYYLHNLTEPVLCPYCHKKRKLFIKLDKGFFATCGDEECKKQGMSMGALQHRDWDKISNKAKQTYKRKHGVEHNMQDPAFIMNRAINNIETKYQYNVTDYNIDTDSVTIKCSRCGTYCTLHDRATVVDMLWRTCGSICPVCDSYKEYRSSLEDNIVSYIKTIYNGEILTNKRIFKQHEYDIILPELKLIIECNGIYWHSYKMKPKSYHYTKLKHTNDNGYKLFYIWEDEWHSNTEYIQQILYNLIHKQSNIITNLSICKYTHHIEIYNNDTLIYKSVYFKNKNNTELYDIYFNRLYNYGSIIQKLKEYVNSDLHVNASTENILYKLPDNFKIKKHTNDEYFYSYMNKRINGNLYLQNDKYNKVYTSGKTLIKIKKD